MPIAMYLPDLLILSSVLVFAVLDTCQGTSIDATLGTTIQLACGDYDGPNATWMKGDTMVTSLTSDSDKRLTIRNSVLVLQGILHSDTGFYTCINQDNVTLAEYEVMVRDPIPTTVGAPTRTAVTYNPDRDVRFADSSLPLTSIMTTTIGSQVVFDCRSTISLSPYIEWRKDRRPIREASYRFSGLDFKWRQQPWVMTLSNVLVADSGIYECQIGSRAISKKKYRKFHLIVEDVRPTAKPVITLFEPRNVTAVVGSRVKLTCHATAKPMPYIKWERTTRMAKTANGMVPVNLTFDESSHDKHEHNVAMRDGRITEIEEANYTVVVETVCVHRAFKDSITIEQIAYNESAAYSCVAFNEFGFTKLTGIVHVIPEPPLSRRELEFLFHVRYGGRPDASDVPISVIVALPVCIVIFIVIGLMYWNEQRKREQRRSRVSMVPMTRMKHNGDAGVGGNDAAFSDHLHVQNHAGTTRTPGANGSVPPGHIILHPLMRVQHMDTPPLSPKSKSLQNFLGSHHSLVGKKTKSDDRIQLIASPPAVRAGACASPGSDGDLEWEQEDLDLQLTLNGSPMEEDAFGVYH